MATGVQYLAQRVGITYANLSILKNNHARETRFSTLQIGESQGVYETGLDHCRGLS